MSIGSQVSECMEKLTQGRFEDAIIPISVAMSATARLEHPTAGDGDACRKFLDANLPIICKIGWVAFGLSQPIDFRYRRLDRHLKKTDVAVRVRKMPEMLYDVVRCTAVHEAKLPDNLRFTEAPLMQTGMDGELVLPADLIYGLLVAVVASPVNAKEAATGNPMFWFNEKTIPLNALWGKRTDVMKFLGI